MNEFEKYTNWCKQNNLKPFEALSLDIYFKLLKQGKSDSPKMVLKNEDLRKILGGVSYDTAARIMREAKAFNDHLNLKGVILTSDWENYCNRGAHANN